MVNAIGGKFEFVEGRFRFRAGRYQERRATHQYKYGDKVEAVFHPIKGSDLSNNMTAEGFRKIGILQQLLTNQSLNPDVSGSLFWDEPESNLNPRLIRLLVEILLELSRNGQQIILATHDYVLLKWFDLLVDLGKADHVRYHSLYRENATVPLRINSTNEYLAIAPNSIDDTFAALINTELDRAMEGLGK
jgi:AAA15 family ATPase/GTPase